jgi:hypothetical protein
MLKVRSEDSLNRKHIAENSHRKRQTRRKQSFVAGGGGSCRYASSEKRQMAGEWENKKNI